MSYCTPDQLTQRYGQKAEAWSASVDSIRIACEDASAEIDGYLSLAGVKDLPLSPVPSYVTSYAIDMAAYLLLVRFGMLNADAESELSTRAAQARKFFDEWAKGQFDAGDKDGVPPGTGGGNKRVQYRTPHKMNMRGYS